MTPPTRPPVDMSPEAIAQRLEELADLYEFWKSIRTANYIGPVEKSAQPYTERDPALRKAGLPGDV